MRRCLLRLTHPQATPTLTPTPPPTVLQRPSPVRAREPRRGVFPPYIPTTGKTLTDREEFAMRGHLDPTAPLVTVERWVDSSVRIEGQFG
jgi:hypothetical protein